MRDRWSPWLPRQQRPYMETGDIILQRSGWRERESERTRNKESVRERVTEKAKKKKKGKGFRISLPLKEAALQEFLLIYLPICSRGGIMERGRGRGGQEERERRHR